MKQETDLTDGCARIDMHVHSKYSRRPSQWVLQKLGCPESFTDPLSVYRIAKARGMTFVTITDHNSIKGAEEIAHLPDTFISEEVTTYFPEDGCKVHVLAYDITESHHKEIGKIRENIYDLVAYLNQERILHVIAHPLYSLNDRLTLAHFEKMLLLFPFFELNGARDVRQNQVLREVFAALTPARIEQLAGKHGIEPVGACPWKKYVTGGSDDHSSLNIARTCVRVDRAHSYGDVLEGIRTGRAVIEAEPPGPLTLAHNLYGIAYQYYQDKFNLQRYAGQDPMMRFLERSLTSEAREAEAGLLTRIYSYWSHRRRPKAETEISQSLMDLLRQETLEMLQKNPDLLHVATQPVRGVSQEQEHRWFDFVNRISNRVMYSFANHLTDHLARGNVFNIFHTIGSAGGLYTLLAPYFVAYSHFTKDRAFNADVRNRFSPSAPLDLYPLDGMKMVHFTDTFHDINGVAKTLQQQVEIAKKTRKQLTVITCESQQSPEMQGVRNFTPVGVCDLPEYPEVKICYPPFLEMLDYCYNEGFTHIHSATPGPVGLAALAISHILKIPINGTYHTQLPQYAEYLTGDEAVADLTWKYTLWYYDQMDFIYVPSKSTGDELIEKGIHPEKIRLFPRGIDIEFFHPRRQNGLLKAEFGIDEKSTKLLYVGRVSTEKNLPMMVSAFKNLLREKPDLHLVVVGEGPYLKEMRKALAGLPVTFTGYLKGERLASVYASCDLFVFPSTTDTFGNVILEAQASGLPVVVTDQGGPKENMIPAKTGFVVRGGDEKNLVQAISMLVDDPKLTKAMGAAARSYMENRSFEQAFLRTWEMYEKPNVPEARFAKAG